MRHIISTRIHKHTCTYTHTHTHTNAHAHTNTPEELLLPRCDLALVVVVSGVQVIQKAYKMVSLSCFSQHRLYGQRYEPAPIDVALAALIKHYILGKINENPSFY